MTLNYTIKEASPLEVKQLLAEKDEFIYLKNFSIAPEEKKKVYIAKSNGKIIGAIQVKAHYHAGHITDFSMRKGYDRQGIGSKLLGKAYSFFIKNEVFKVKVWSTSKAEGYYQKQALFKESEKQFIFEFVPKPNPRKRKKRVRTQLSPQNVMRKDKLIRRKR